MNEPLSRLPDRIRDRIDVQPDGCWTWTGSRTQGGYGRIGNRLVHRLVYEALVGPIPANYQVGHVCHDLAAFRGACDTTGGRTCPHRACCNPDHLRPQTPRQNVLASANTPGRRTHCPKGHPLVDGNLDLSKLRQGRRSCLTCTRARTQGERGQAERERRAARSRAWRRAHAQDPAWREREQARTRAYRARKRAERQAVAS